MSAETLAAIYEGSELRHHLTLRMEASSTEPVVRHHYSQVYASSTLEQFGTLLSRGFLEKRRDNRTSVTSVLRAVVIGLFMGSLFYHQELNPRGTRP